MGGLIDPQLVKDAKRASRKIIDKLHDDKNRLKGEFELFKFGSVLSYSDNHGDGGNTDDADDSFRKIALDSAIPPFIAKILFQYSSSTPSSKATTTASMETNEKTLRVLNDAFLIKSGKEDKYCGWHVDDAVFWPCSAHQQEQSKTASLLPDGVNAWIALDDIPTSTYGGGMYICPRSHCGPATLSNHEDNWIYKGYESIGSTKTFPIKGYRSFTQMGKNLRLQTCELAKLSPSLNQQFESNAITFDYQCGDVLLMNRWLWHRSANLNSRGKVYYEKRKIMFPRYTVRYECGDTRLLNGVSLHPSFFHNEAYSGKSLNEICNESNLPFFPKAWSSSSTTTTTTGATTTNNVENMKYLVQDVLPRLQQKQFEATRTLFSMNAANNKQ